MWDARKRSELAARAEVTKAALEALWGSELPPTQDPVRDVLADAVDVDDQAGRDGGLVVQGDRLSLDTLAVLVDRARAPHDAEPVEDLLPDALREEVRRRLARLRVPGEPRPTSQDGTGTTGA